MATVSVVYYHACPDSESTLHNLIGPKNLLAGLIMTSDKLSDLQYGYQSSVIIFICNTSHYALPLYFGYCKECKT